MLASWGFFAFWKRLPAWITPAMNCLTCRAMRSLSASGVARKVDLLASR